MKEVIWPPPTFNLMHLLKISRISHEKEKYMRLAECEAETICNLGKGSKINLHNTISSYSFGIVINQISWTPSVEKENFNLSDMLSQAEEKLKNEKEKYKVLETSHSVKSLV